MKSHESRTLDARPVTLEVLSASDFVSLTAEQKRGIKVVEIVAPRLGEKNFGGVRIKHDSPIYKVFK
ncbi:hypothetical protein ABB26_05150 [Stenotrophomonas humi]|uniref:Uncharacterized protein n=1 Tax=Stenotrophomonas humi TaxID=405444 RepID=A0A0R0C642_9GAMM|nr:hypothetical protein [Stenotrophomonas humi]KRG65193.1 hypothetical protein ABB26_05150 [Stenotrophomonas humi]